MVTGNTVLGIVSTALPFTRDCLLEELKSLPLETNAVHKSRSVKMFLIEWILGGFRIGFDIKVHAH